MSTLARHCRVIRAQCHRHLSHGEVIAAGYQFCETKGLAARHEKHGFEQQDAERKRERALRHAAQNQRAIA